MHNLIAVNKLSYKVKFNSSEQVACIIQNKASRMIVSILSKK